MTYQYLRPGFIEVRTVPCPPRRYPRTGDEAVEQEGGDVVRTEHPSSARRVGSEII